MSMQPPPKTPHMQPQTTSTSGSKTCLIVGIIIAVVGGIPICICGGCFAAVYFGVSGVIKASEPYQIAMERAGKNQAVIDALGEPLKTGAFTNAQHNTSGSQTDVELTCGISGPKGSGTLRLHSIGNTGNWDHKVMEVQVDGKTIDLREGADGDGPAGDGGLSDIFKKK